MLASVIFRRFSLTASVSPRFFSAIVVRPMIAFIGVRISWDIVERKSVFALLAEAASMAAAWNFLAKERITATSNMNRIRSPAEIKPIKSQFSVFTRRSLTGMKLSSVQPSVAVTGI